MSLVELSTPTGKFIGEPRGNNGWMVLHTCEPDPDVPPDQVMQQSSCPTTAESFVKPFEGRYRNLTEGEQRECLEVMQAGIRALGGRIPPDMGQPLWLQAEFLENVINFELHPPCGCKPERRKPCKSNAARSTTR